MTDRAGETAYLDTDFYSDDFLHGGHVPGTSVGSGGTGGGGDPPLVVWSLPSGTQIHRQQSIGVTITDADTVKLILSASIPDVGVHELIYRGGSFAPRYTGSQVDVNQDTTTITIRRSGGWPSTPTIFADVVDSKGQIEDEQV